MKLNFFRFKKKAAIAIGFLLITGLLFSAGWIKVLYPNGGEVLKCGTPVQIKWQSQGLNGKVILVLYKKGIKHSVIVKQTANTGKFLWKIPGNLPEGSDYRIRIRGIQDLAINDFSDRDFSIKK